MNPRTTLTSSLALLAFGCASSDAPPATAVGVTVRDSVGVAIVEHAAGYEDSLPVWDVPGKPVLDIGGGEETGQQLDLIRGAVRLGDGRIVVANAGTSELRVFDSTGKYLYAIGRKGQGPGEFVSLGMVWRLPGDTLVAMDYQLRRFSVFVPSGEFVSSSGGMVRSARGGVDASLRLLDGRLVGTEIDFGEMKETSGPVRRVPFAVLGIGLAAGLTGAIGLTRLLQGFFFRVHPIDPLAFLVAIAAMAAVVLIAAMLPAARAARIDPMSSIRID